MTSLEIYGIPTLVVFDSNGKVITKSGKAAVEGNPEECLGAWKNGKAGVRWTTGINWFSILFYILLIYLWRLWSQSKSGGESSG